MEDRFKFIKDFEKYSSCSNGHIYSNDYNHTGQRKMLKETLDKDGYPYVRFVIDKKRYKKMVHRLIAETFVQNPLNKTQVNHKNGIKTDNRVENLEWVTNGENQIHAFKNNLQKGNFEHHNSKLTLEQVLYIKNNCIVGSKLYGIQTLAKKFNVCNTTIKQIIQGKSYRYVNKSDNIGKI